ncbi:hypothetical protein CTM53_04510 [Prevotella intermedia]|uniref:Uncharacterized protein n=1 Tax=Prevotella intermedia TaxID=28131 RepID=A0AAJ3VE15_PREIN|nr:hypothetical protein [Prevotella intermedia]ATV54887.1 hypothetical protein CTM61_05270 [Prevotella intermedia]PJI20140.1 hypothetical protein CTM53_04510 [Prevotella intermedia]
MRIYNITQTSHISINGVEGMNNETSQQWKVSTTEDGNVVIDVLALPEQKQQANAEIYQLLNIINKSVSRIEFGFDTNDMLKLHNSNEIASRYKSYRNEIISIFGNDLSIMQLLDVVGNATSDFSREMRSSLLYYTLWSWFGGGKSFHINPLSILHANHHVNVGIARAKKEVLPDKTIHLVERGEGILEDIASFENDYLTQIHPLTNGAPFNYKYSVETEYFCAEDYQPFFDRAVTSVREQASDDYVYINKIEFKLVEERI